MEEYIVKIRKIEQVTPDVKRFQVDRPQGYAFIPGQATDVSINTPGLKDETRPFTFTGLNSAPHLEFTIKIYPSRNGITNEIGKLKPGSELIIRDVWGAIHFKGSGVFIAGGAGITPFISILRDLESRNEAGGNILIFANKKKEDIIIEQELKKILKNGFINILSEEKAKGYFHGLISTEFLRQNIPDFSGNFYVCGPPPMMDSVLNQLEELGVRSGSITLEL